jgi:hypothetical protein
MSKCNKGVGCTVRSCANHLNNDMCGLKTISIASDMNERHYCRSFEERPGVTEF